MKLQKTLILYILIAFCFFSLSIIVTSTFPGFFAKQTDSYNVIIESKSDYIEIANNYLFPSLLSRYLGLTFVHSTLAVHSIFLFLFLLFAQYFLFQVSLFAPCTSSLILKTKPASLASTLFLFPSFIFFFFTSLREVDIAFVSSIIMLSSFLYRLNKSYTALVVLISFSLILFFLRAEYAPFLFASSFLIIVLPFYRVKHLSSIFLYALSRRLLRLSTSVFFFQLFTLLALVFAVLIFSDFVSSKIGLNTPFSLEYISTFIQSRLVRSYDAGSNISCGTFSYFCTLAAWPFAPLPLDPFRSVFFIITLIDSIVLLLKYRIALRRIQNTEPFSILLLAFLPFLALLSVISLFAFNIGNIFRLRASMAPIFAVLCFILFCDQYFFKVSPQNRFPRVE